MKELLKKIIIIWTVICMLLPTLFTGIVLAADENNGYLNSERAGNFVANFAINFYENWSSISSSVETETTAAYSKSVNGYIFPVKDTNVGVSRGFGGADVHQGYDIFNYGAQEGVVDVYSVCNGRVVQAGFEASMGNHVIVEIEDRGSQFWIRYMHMAYNPLVKAGDVVEAGTPLGKMGNTGASQGTHLHIDFSVASEDEAKRLKEQLGDYIYSTASYRYFFDPLNFIPSIDDFLAGKTNEGSGQGSATTTSTKVTARGTVKTEYDEDVDPKAEVIEGDEVYKFNNISWIGFVYSNSIFRGDKGNSEYGIDDILKGTGKNSIIVNNATMDNKAKIEGIKETINTSPVLDISRLISEGKLLPGDILYANKGNGSGEYLLYVGGSKVIYATGDISVGPSGALKYEYLIHYLQRIKRNLQDEHEDEQDYVIPEYGITEVYRIKNEVAENIPESDANLIFDGKGYYSNTVYDGVPRKTSVSTTKINVFKWLFSLIKQLLEFLINLVVYIVRMQIVGWTNLFENLIQSVVMGISGHNETAGIEKFFGPSGTSASGERITVESIFYNKIPILDANFFNFETAGGHSLLLEDESGEVVEDSETQEPVSDESNLIYKLRNNLRAWYMVIRNASIAIMLFLLIIYGIKIAITTSTNKKADYKKFLISWLVSMLVVVFVHLFMYLVFMVNDQLVNICSSWANDSAQEATSELVKETKVQQEMNLYDAVRIKAYAFDWHEGVPATILYVFMVYLMIRFLFIYLKRLLTIYILALSGSFMGVKHAIDKLNGRKTTSLNKWAKDFAFNVLLQTVHAFIYVLFMSTALEVSGTSIGGALIAFVILNFMLKADSIIIQIFGLNKADSLAAVNQPESFKDTFRKFLPVFTVGSIAFNLGKKIIDQPGGIIYQLRVASTGKDNLKDAKKALEQRRYNRIGTIARGMNDIGTRAQQIQFLKIGDGLKKVSQTRIKNLWKYNKYYRQLGKGLSPDTNKAYYQMIRSARNLGRQRFKRKVNLLRDTGLGLAGMVAAPAVAISNLSAGAAMWIGGRSRFDKYRTVSGPRIGRGKYTGLPRVYLHDKYHRTQEYYGTIKDAKEAVRKAESKYRMATNLYTNNEYNYQEARNALLDSIAGYDRASAEYANLRTQIGTLDAHRKVEKSKEIHAMKDAYEQLEEAKQVLGNARHDRSVINNALSAVGAVTGAVTAVVPGAETIANIAAEDAKASYKEFDTASKNASKLEDFEKVVAMEGDVRTLTEQLKQLYDQYASEKGLSEEEETLLMKREIGKTQREAKTLNVRSSYITMAVEEYLYENNITKVTDENVDDVLRKLENKLIEAGSGVRLSAETRNKIKKKMKQKMTNDEKGLGLDTKDTTTTIRKALGDIAILEDTGASDIVIDTADSDSAKAIREQIRTAQKDLLHKLRDINTYNEVGKAKYKQSLVNVNKIMKDAKKKVGVK